MKPLRSLSILRPDAHHQMGGPERRSSFDGQLQGRLALWLADVAAEAALTSERAAPDPARVGPPNAPPRTGVR
jgi:hypothetical protein